MGIVLKYFPIMGAAERVRLALWLGEIEFEDARVPPVNWAELKGQPPFGQLPVMSIDEGPYIAQSNAMLQYIGTLAPRLCPADRFFKNKSIPRHYVAGDIDGNGLNDLILVHLGDQGGSQLGTSLQVLVQVKKRKFKDKTKHYIPFGGSYKQGDWSYALHLADLNNDKRKDLIVQNVGPLRVTGEVSPPRVFLQQRNKQFKPVRISNLTGSRDWILFGIQPVDIDGDGQMELVGQNKFEASNPAKNYFTIQVVELTTKKVKTKFVSY